jgi:hypothetical protein
MTNPISRDGFQAWLTDPVTQFVVAGLRRLQEQAQVEWLRESWNSGVADQGKLDRLRVRFETWGDLANITIEDAYGANGQPLEEDS